MALVNTATTGSSSPPKFGNGSIVTNGTTDYVYTGAGTNLGTNAWYVGFWCNESQSGVGTNGTLISIDTNTTSGANISAFSIQRMGLTGSTGTVGNMFYKVSINGTTADLTATGSNYVPNSTWNYFACNHTASSGYIYCSVNGSLDASIVVPAAQSLYYNGTSSSIFIGTDGGKYNFTKGAFDDIVIINGNAYNTFITPAWEFVQPMAVNMGLNHTFINGYQTSTQNSTGLVNITYNQLDVTATNMTINWGDPYFPQINVIPAQNISFLAGGNASHYYSHEGIYTITETISNLFTSGSNSTWVLAVS